MLSKVLALVWKSFTPASKKSSRSDCNAFPVRAMIGVFTPIIRNFLVACNSERNFENNISRTIHRRNQLIHLDYTKQKKLRVWECSLTSWPSMTGISLSMRTRSYEFPCACKSTATCPFSASSHCRLRFCRTLRNIICKTSSTTQLCEY